MSKSVLRTQGAQSHAWQARTRVVLCPNNLSTLPRTFGRVEMPGIRTSTYLVTYARVGLLRLQMDWILRRSGIAASAREAIVRGIENRWIENVTLNWLNSANFVMAQLSINVDWNMFSLRAAVSEFIEPSPLRSAEATGFVDAIESFLGSIADESFHVSFTIRYVRGVDRDEANQVLGFKRATPVKWAGGADERIAATPEELDEFTISLRLVGISSGNPESAASGNSAWADEPNQDVDTDIRTRGHGVDELSQSKPLAELGVDVYLATDNQQEIEQVFSAVEELVDLLGYGHSAIVGEFRGSIFRKMKAVSRETLTSRELRDRLIKVERAIELNYLDAKQADVDGKEAEAVSKLVGALENVPEACVRLGSILLIKYHAGTGPIIVTRNLSQIELRAMERFPEIQTKPSNVLTGLAAAVASLEAGEVSGV